MKDISLSYSSLARAKAVIYLMRPKHWLKNGFVLAPLVFTGKFIELEAIAAAAWALSMFCIAASAVYVLNDIRDRERDRLHPTKSLSRPLAAGIISVRAAIAVLAVLYGILLGMSFAAPSVGAVILAYVILNVLYSVTLKHQPVLDIFTIALGFVLRVSAGAFALGVPLSPWMAITTLSLALYLAAVKRRQELSQSGSLGRGVLERYSPELIDRYAEMSATGALVFYCMFVMTERPEMTVTVPLVLFGLFRYWYVVDVRELGESPADALTQDLPLAATVAIWVGVCMWVLWPG